eukprot:Clim_evm32s236 gene=Clim_evmTU32s236
MSLSKQVDMGGVLGGLAEAIFSSQHRRRNLGLLVSAVALAGTYSYVLKVGAKADRQIGMSKKGAVKRNEKVAVGNEFYARLGRLLKICVPSLFSPEAGFIGMASVFMVLRTLCDLWMISINTRIEARIIDRDVTGFRNGLLQFFAGMVPMGFVNSFLKYSLNEMALRFRTRLTNHLLQEYLKGFTYYKVAFLDTRISNADQLLTQDVDRFCQSVVDLYSNLSKPILDIIIYARRLTELIGAGGPAIMTGYLGLSGVLLTRLRKPVGKFTVGEQRLEGEYRFVNARIITHGEEIAFYNGGDREKVTVFEAYNRLQNHLRDSMRFRFSIGVIDNVVAKYFATVVGFFAVSRPFLNDPYWENVPTVEISEAYNRSGRMLVRMAGAIGRVVLAGREMTRLAGFTARVIDIMDVLEDLEKGHYSRTMLSLEGKEVDGVPLAPGNGKIIHKDHLIKFDRVPVVTPNGDVLVKELNITIKSGENVLVSGPNGCGKSSLFRILGGLWPLFGGTMTKPAAAKLFYVPQKPYLTIGTLRDQVIYPDSAEDMKRRGLSDQGLFKFLDEVHLSHLVDREGGWDAVQDWADVLSGGEKQRVAMARLFYHKPQFAILDECTSAVSVDVEGYMYTHSRELGITLFTVSHRKSLWKFHEYVLHFDGRGSYEFKKIEGEGTEWGS